jgi:hypothetical protein
MVKPPEVESYATSQAELVRVADDTTCDPVTTYRPAPPVPVRSWVTTVPAAVVDPLIVEPIARTPVGEPVTVRRPWAASAAPVMPEATVWLIETV